MEQDRRQYIRRAADREMRGELQQLRQAAGDGGAAEQRRRLRRAIRHTCSVRIAVQVGARIGGGNAWSVTDHPIPGRLLDLSAEGCQLFTRNALDIDTQLSLAITLQTGEEIRAAGVVRWTKGVPEKKGFALGVAFTRAEADAQTRIQAFLEYLDRTGGL